MSDFLTIESKPLILIAKILGLLFIFAFTTHMGMKETLQFIQSNFLNGSYKFKKFRALQTLS